MPTAQQADFSVAVAAQTAAQLSPGIYRVQMIVFRLELGADGAVERQDLAHNHFVEFEVKP
jgi:hypothetical protein